MPTQQINGDHPDPYFDIEDDGYLCDDEPDHVTREMETERDNVGDPYEPDPAQKWENGLPPDTIESLRYDLEGQAQRAEYYSDMAHKMEQALKELLRTMPIMALEDGHPFGLAIEKASVLIDSYDARFNDDLPF